MDDALEKMLPQRGCVGVVEGHGFGNTKRRGGEHTRNEAVV